MSKVIFELELKADKTLSTLKQINEEIKAQAASLDKQKIGTKAYADQEKALTKLKDTKKALTSITKEEQKAAASLEKQRQRGLAAMAKQEAKERELITASKMTAKSYEEMSRKMSALNTLRKREDLSTKQGAENYKRMSAEVNRLNTSLKSMDKQGGTHSRNVGQYFQKAYVASAAAIMGVFMALRRVAGAVKESVGLYLEQQKQTQLVKNVFGDYADTINDAANATQKLTTVGNEAYQALAIQASNFGVEQEKVNEVVQGSIGLAAKFEAAGLSQETALKGLALAMNGDFTQLQRYIPALKTATTESEKMALVQEAMASGFNLAQEQAKTEAGQLEQLKNTTGDVKERFGELVMKGLKPVIENLHKFMQGLDDDGKFANLISNIKQGIKFIIAFIVGLKAYAVAQNLAAKAGEKFTFSLKGVKNALKGMKSSLAGVGVGVFLVAITAIVSELSKFIKNMRTSADVSKTVNERMQESTTRVNALFDAIENENTSQEDRVKLMNEVNNRYGEYLPFLLTEENYLENIAIAREKVLDGIRREIEMTARQEKAAEVYKQILDIEEEIAKIGAGGGLRTAILGQSADLEIRLTELSKLYETYNSLLSDVTDAEIESITSAENLTDSTENLTTATTSAITAEQGWKNILQKINEEYKLNIFLANQIEDSRKRNIALLDAEKTNVSALLSEYKKAALANDGIYDEEERKQIAAYTKQIEDLEKAMQSWVDVAKDAAAADPFKDYVKKSEEMQSDIAGNFDGFSFAELLFSGDVEALQAAKTRYEEFMGQYGDLAKNGLQAIDEIWHNSNDKKEIAIDKLLVKSDAYYDNEIANADGDEERQKQLTSFKEREQRKLNKQKVDIARKEAKLAKGTGMLSAGIATSSAIIGALAPPPIGLGIPAGIPFSIAAGVTGALQLAAIASQPLPQYHTGGYTGDGGKYEPKGVVHGGEVVFSKRDVQMLGGASIVDSMRPTSTTTNNYYTGGIVGFSSAANTQTQSSDVMMQAISRIKPVVTVEDINAGQRRNQNRVNVSYV